MGAQMNVLYIYMCKWNVHTYVYLYLDGGVYGM